MSGPQLHDSIIDDVAGDPLDDGWHGAADSPDSSLPSREQIHALVSDEVIFVEPAASIRVAAETMRAADVGLLVVGTSERAIGVLSERDVTDAVARRLDVDEMLVGAIEHDDLRWTTAEAPVVDVAEEMLESHLRHVLVRADDGSLLGVVSIRDILGSLLV